MKPTFSYSSAITVFVPALLGAFVYMAGWAKFLTGDWASIHLSTELPYIIALGCSSSMVIVAYQYHRDLYGRSLAMVAWATVAVMFAMVLPHEKYQLLHPGDKSLYWLAPTFPIFFVIWLGLCSYVIYRCTVRGTDQT